MAKIAKCKACGADVAKGVKACPSCGKDKRSFFGKHKIISGLLVLVLLGSFGNALGGGGKDSGTTTANSANTATNTTAQQTAQPAATVAPEVTVPTEYKSALSKATSYANVMHMSKIGVYNQLISEYGEKFSKEAAQYAIDNVTADWNANALAKAKSYQEQMSMSTSSIRDQLVSEYGEKFTADEADYAIKHLND
jgi:hypothetical protein